MDRDTFEKQKPFAGEKKPSMLRRCVDNDYTARRMYMVTMVTEGRKPLFGRVAGNSMAIEPAVITVSYILFVLFSGKKLPAFFVFPIVSVLAAVFFMQSVNGIPPFIISVVLGIVFAFVFNALIPYRD